VTLRSRLLLGLVGIVLAGLLVSGIVTYKSLESFLVTRLNQQLTDAPTQTARDLSACISAGGTIPAPTQCHTFDLPSVPAGTFAELRPSNGSGLVVSAWLIPTQGSQKKPNLPNKLMVSNPDNPKIFNVSSASGLEYHAVAVNLTNRFFLGTVIIAVPLTDVDQTLNRLLLVELLVSGCVLLVLGGVSWWIVKAGLKPLDDMTETAGAIAAGDLTRRVPESEGGTEVGRLGQALNVMLGEIEGAFAARTASEERLRRFLADASHELRTPLTSIRGYAEMFDRGARDRPEDLATSMRYIKADADRMSALVEDLMLLARLDRERPLLHEQVDLRVVLEPAVTAIEMQDVDRTFTLRAPESAWVVGDANRLRQVVDNLLVNATRHTPAGTPIEVFLTHDGASAFIEVIDHGGGVPPDEREKIFEPFHRFDSSRSRATGGQGLGLAIVASIVQAHDGDVRVTDTPGGGATFWIRLPLVHGAVSQHGAEVGHSNGKKPWSPAPGYNDTGTVPIVAPRRSSS